MSIKERSPFCPGAPLPYELFAGRIEQVRELLHCAKEASTGKPRSVFLIGPRGIGKSSLASFIRYYLSQNEDFLSIHVFPGRTVTLEEIIRQVFEQLLKQARSETWFDDVKSLFGRSIKEVGLFGVTVAFSPPEDDLEELVRNFPEALHNLWEKIKGKKKGIFIALDDLNALVEKTHFANWYKSFADEVATSYKDFPVFTLLIGLPEQRVKLAEQQPSLMRIFKIVNIDKLTDDEVEDFTRNAFEKVGMTVDRNALQTIVRYSSGLPALLHEIGDAAFWFDDDGVINQKDADPAIVTAAREIGKKYLDPKVYDALRSENYRSILKTLGREIVLPSFTKHEVEKRLTERERKVLNNFITKLKKLGVIEADTEKGRGHYKYVNELYAFYIWMQSQVQEPEDT